jgi:hypothetical protein
LPCFDIKGLLAWRFLDNEDAVVKGQAGDGTRKVGDLELARLLRMPSVDQVDKLLAVLDERAPIPGEVAVVNLEVMLSLMDQIPRVFDKVRFEIVHEHPLDLLFTIYELRFS